MTTLDYRLFDFNIYNTSDGNSRESYESDGSDETTNHFEIQMFGINLEGETCSMIIQNYKPFFYIKVPNNWNKSKVKEFQSDLFKRLGQQVSSQIYKIKLVEKKKLYGFDGGLEHKFLEVIFYNTSVMNRVKYLFYRKTNNESKLTKFMYQGKGLELYESHIPPLLRYFHIQNISPSGWVQINTEKCVIPEYRTTTCTYEYILDCNNVIPLNDKEDPVPYKICSFDIEASSSHGDFPIPIKNYKKLATNIVDYFQNSNVEICDDILKSIIYNAFNYEKYLQNDIQNVYPKTEPNRKTIEKLANYWASLTLMKLKKMKYNKNKEEDNSNVDLSLYEYRDDDDNDGGNNVFGNTVKKRRFTTLNATEVYKMTVIEILVSPDIEYDDKINYLISSFNGFPKLQGDEVTFIGSTFVKYGSTEPYLNHCVVLDTCDEMEDVKNSAIESYKTERELLLAWTKIINEENPDIIIGYNIFGFDYDFMFQRAKENKCVREFLQMSRNLGEVCGKETDKGGWQIEKSKIVIASGEHNLNFIKMNGRIQVDLYNYFRRDYNLPSYKLDYVSSQFIGDGVKSLTHNENTNETTIHTKNMMGIEIGSFIHFEETAHSSELYKDGAKFKIASMDKENKYFTINGLEYVDMSKHVKWGLAKDDVTPQDIFRLSKESAAGRAIIAKYCIQDCNLIHHLMNKIDVITGFIEMAKICSVPIEFLVLRGQGIKLTSFIAKKCREKDTLMPVLERPDYRDPRENEQWNGYDGAIVLDPKCNLYLDNPVACVDYASLYPSSMISENLSHDSKVWVKEYDLNDTLIKMEGNDKYDNLEGYQYVDIKYDTYSWSANPRGKLEKVVSGYRICRWAQFPNHEKGIMPSILEELLAARKATRKLIPQQSDDFMKNILDKRQLSYKITANSLYGQCGAKTSTFFEKDVAASTTATGRLLLTYAKRVVEDVYGDKLCNTNSHGMVMSKAEYIYGDSVAKYTPLYLRIDGQLEIITMEELAQKYGNNEWIQCEEQHKETKEVCNLNDIYIETWTDDNWTRIHRIIRHKLAPMKQMVRVVTHNGIVDVTDDHSLLRENGEEISPKQANVGTKLLHKILEPNDVNNEINITQFQNPTQLMESQILGFFFGDGSCGVYNCQSGKKSSWAINNSSLLLLEEYRDLCEVVYPQFEWIIYDTIESSGVYKLTFNGGTRNSKTAFIEKYRSMMYYQDSKVIPSYILNSTYGIREAFWNGLYDADGDKDKNGYSRIDQKSQLSAAHISWLANSIGYEASLNCRKDKPHIYRITTTKHKQRKDPHTIKKMEAIQYDDYVYDLTTENHHFAAGIGNMIVHNTDSVFFTFNLQDHKTGEPIRGKKALEMTIELAKEAGKLATKFLKAPHDLEYEKTFMPFCLLSKKRYVGMLYEEDPDKCKQKSMGIVLKRRDNAPIVKDVYGGIIDILMNEQNIEKAVQFLKQMLQNMIDEKIPIEKLIISKSLRSNYKNPKQIAHKVLADRMGKRDPGNKPASGDRIPYAYIKVKDKKALQGDKIEHPSYISEKKLQLDYAHYITNQIMKPIQQLLALVLEEIPEYSKKPMRIKAMNEHMVELKKSRQMEEINQEQYDKKVEDYRNREIKSLLFDRYIEKTLIERVNITRFFKHLQT